MMMFGSNEDNGDGIMRDVNMDGKLHDVLLCDAPLEIRTEVLLSKDVNMVISILVDSNRCSQIQWAILGRIAFIFSWRWRFCYGVLHAEPSRKSLHRRHVVRITLRMQATPNTE